MREIVEPTLARHGGRGRAVPRRPVRRAHDRARRAARPRVQRALRRSRGHRARAHLRRRLVRASRRRGARATSRPSRASGSARGAALSRRHGGRGLSRQAAHGRSHRGPRRAAPRRAPSSSTPAPRARPTAASSTSGGRVLAVGAHARDAARTPRGIAYDVVGRIRWRGEHHRRDIGSRALVRIAEGESLTAWPHRPAHPAALRPRPRCQGDLARVVAPPYDVISPEERAALAARDPHNVVRLILPEGEGDAKYAHAGRAPREVARRAACSCATPSPAFYRLEQTFLPPGAAAGTPPITRRGFLALVELVPFSRPRRAPPRAHALGPEGGPAEALPRDAHEPEPGLHAVPRRRAARSTRPSRGRSRRGVLARPTASRHALAKVSRPEAVRAIVEGVARSTLLIADGHHRYETALRYAAGGRPGSPGGAPLGASTASS